MNPAQPDHETTLGQRQALHSGAIAPPRFPYSQCVRIGQVAQVSGMVALHPHTNTLVTGGPGVETTRILENLALAMTDYGLTLDELLTARLFTTQFDKFAEINIAWSAFFDDQKVPPARTAVGVSALPLGATIEIEFTFVKASVAQVPCSRPRGGALEQQPCGDGAAEAGAEI